MTETIARCSIYEDRPQICRDYPTASHWVPEECTYTFPGGAEKREGSCSCGTGACCRVPREGGEPGAPHMPEISGGQPCKYLVFVDKPMEKEAEDEPALTESDAGTQDLLAVVGQGENYD